MLTALQLLKEDLRNHKDVSGSILGVSNIWKANHYKELSELINENLKNNKNLQGERKFEIGNSISAITLKRFFENEISENTFNDLRFIKTLDKLCIFLGYESFNAYWKKNQTKISPIECSKKEHKHSKIYEIVKNCAKAEFEILYQLPEINLENFNKYVIKNSPYYHRYLNNFTTLRNKKLKIHPNRGVSNFEVYNIGLQTETPEMLVLHSKEFWNLIFINIEGKILRHHIHNEQNYFLKKDGDTWKIWDNFNPNSMDVQKFG